MKRLEACISSITLRVIKRPKTILSLFFLLALVLIVQMQHLRFDVSSESFLNKEHPQRLAYLDFENKYGLSAYFIVLIEHTNLFSETVIKHVQNLEQHIVKNVPNVADVESISSATYITSEDDSIVIDSFFSEDLSQVDFKDKKKIATTKPYYLHRLINSTGDATAIIVKLSQYAKDAEKESVHRLDINDVLATLSALKEEANAYQTYFDKPILIGGSPTITAELTKATKQEMLIFSLLSIFLVACVLFAKFQRIGAVAFPLLCLVLCVAMVFSLMAIGKYPIQITGSILPSFLLAVCVGDAVHFLSAYYKHAEISMKKIDAIKAAIQHSGVAMFFTTLTTSLGLLSFSNSDIAPVASFGLFSALGVWFAFFLTIIVLPCMLMLGAELSIKSSRAEKLNSLWLVRYVEYITQHAMKVVIVAVVLIFISGFYASQLRFSYNPLEWFADNNPVKVAAEHIEKQLTGTMQVELLIKPINKHQEALLLEDFKKIDFWLTTINKQTFNQIVIQSSVSIIDLLKEATDVLDSQQGYQLPNTQELLAQELLLLSFDAQDRLDSMMNDNNHEMRITLSIPWQDSLQYTVFVNELENHFSETIGESLQLEVTGMATVANRAFTAMIFAMGVSYLQAAIVVMLVMIVLFRRLKLCLSLIIPNVLPIIFVLAMMVWVSVPLDMFTMLIGSIAIGIVIDDTIHFLHSFQFFFKKHQDSKNALVETLESTGVAMITTTLVLSVGFLVYTVSSLSNLQAFGYLTALTLFVALLADLIVLPAVVFLLYKNNNY
jgi:hypothetical protein